MESKIKYPILGYAPGFYLSKCMNCKEEFMGDKYARQCEPCAINLLNDKYKETLLKLTEVNNVISKLKEVKEFLNKNEL
jgi:hypothetical protein